MHGPVCVCVCVCVCLHRIRTSVCMRACSRCAVRSSADSVYLETSRRARPLIENAKLPTRANNGPQSPKVQSSNKGPRKRTEACLAAPNM